MQAASCSRHRREAPAPGPRQAGVPAVPGLADTLTCSDKPAGHHQSEGDTNLTSRRAAWQARALDEPTRALLAEDERHFLRQSVSTPCLNAITRAEGIWIEDKAGRRYMDFHGNNVHHIGYGHPRLKRAIAEEMDRLPFAPRRYTCETSVALAKKIASIAPVGSRRCCSRPAARTRSRSR